MEPKNNCENCERELTGSKDFQYCEFCKSMWEAGKQEMFNKVKEVSKSFVHGDNPPRFLIDEDNLEEFLEELKNVPRNS